MAISMARAKVLCTASELALVKASSKREIGSHTAARLRQKETRVRKLRDKWRDQAKRQQRVAQARAGARGVAASKNSAEKADLFDEVLARYTARLAKVEATGETAGPMGRRRSTKTSRSRTHRAARANVRGELAEAKRSLKSKSKKSSPPKAAKPTPQPAAASEETEAELAVVKQPAAKRKPIRPALPANTELSALEAGRKVQGLHVTREQQRAARTAAKQDRLKASGFIRIQKNRSAANKRNQGKRDSR